MRDRALGLDIGGHGVKGVLVDGEGRVLKEERRDIPSAKDRGVDAVFGRVVELVGALAQGLPTVPPIGCGVPGFHDHRSGLLRASPNFPEWVDLPVARLLAEKTGAPVVVENDANCAVLGEAWCGAARGAHDVVLLTLGTGVGAGFLTGGVLVRGARGAGAEGGHLALYPGGRRCGCGQHGCLETYASGPGLVATAKEAFHEGGGAGKPPFRTAEDVFAALPRNPEEDHWARRAVRRFALDLAQGLASLVHIFSPEVIVLGGGLARALPRFRGDLEDGLRDRSIAACLGDALPVRAAELAEAGAVGAAWAALSSGEGAAPVGAREEPAPPGGPGRDLPTR
jgi:glucokinase